MNIEDKDVTFVIVTYHSKNVIDECLRTLPNNSKKIIIENSGNNQIKQDLEKNFENLKVILNDNTGMGSGSNVGLKKCTTRFAYILNPDVRFPKNSFEKVMRSIKLISDFAIVTPINSNKNFPNYTKHKKNFFAEKFFARKISSFHDINSSIISVDKVDGFSMLLNLSKFNNDSFFDEKIFLFKESTDLCMRVIQNGHAIYVLKNVNIDHLRGQSQGFELDYDALDEISYLRGWHFFWSLYYINRKYNGRIIALIKIFYLITKFLIKYLHLFSKKIFLKDKDLQHNYATRKLLLIRISGAINSVLGRPSFYRIKKKLIIK